MCSVHLLPFYGHKYCSLHHGAGEAVTIYRNAETLGYVSFGVSLIYTHNSMPLPRGQIKRPSVFNISEGLHTILTTQ